MTEIRYKNAIVRIHGNYDPDNVKAASEAFMKKVERKRKNEKKNNEKIA